MNCTVQVEFNAGVTIEWSYPGKQVSRSCQEGSCPVSDRQFSPRTFGKDHTLVSSDQTNNSVDTKYHRDALSHATEAVNVLTIQSASTTDSGPYTCNVTSLDPTQTKTLQVIVHGMQCLLLFFFCITVSFLTGIKYWESHRQMF